MLNPTFSAWIRGHSLWARGLLVFFLTMPSFAFAAQEIDVQVHDWLGWGEFDSAVVALEKAMQDPGLTQGDAATYAKYWCWLGIAFHGRNQSQAGDSAFRRTLAMKADFEIEENLVTRDLARRFHDLAESQKRANLLRDSVVLAKLREAALTPSPVEPENETAPKPTPKSTSSRSTALWWKTAVGIGAAGALIAGGTFAYLTWHSTPEKTPDEKIWDIPAPK